MCQIISGPSAKVKSILLTTDGLLEELHRNNPDGWGAMYHTATGNKAIKKLPKTAAQTRALVAKLPDDDRQVALHWRWKTSGLVDKENAHPHEVDGGWLIHNGVLDVDMSVDRDRCDTFHFARQYLDGVVQKIVESEKLQAMLGAFIGDNRFVLLDDAGKMVIINKQQGYVAQGVWFANMYSMSRALVDPTYVAPRYYFGKGGGVYKPWDEYVSPIRKDWWHGDTGHETEPLDVSPEDTTIVDAVNMADVDMVADLLEFDPKGSLMTLFDEFVITPHYAAKDKDLTEANRGIRNALVRRDRHELENMLDFNRAAPYQIAETLLYYCDADSVMMV